MRTYRGNLDGRSMNRKDNEQLGDILLEAREARGLSLDDLVELTDVRRSYLIALESGHYAALSEPVYAKTALRRYAQAVGLDVTRMLSIYRQEQRRAEALPESNAAASITSEPSLSDADTEEATAFYGREQGRGGARIGAFGRFATTLMLVIGVVVLALWGFNALLFQPTPYTEAVPGAPADTSPDIQTSAPSEAASEDTPSDDLILLSVNTTPPGARVSIDGLPFDAVSPILDAPVSAGEDRTVQVSLAGYESVEQRVDLTQSRNLNIALSPAADSAANAVIAVEPADTSSTPATPETPVQVEGSAVFIVEAPAWLEVYGGSARGEGERLYYGTAEAGETLTFDLPIYVHTGNGGGVSYAVGGEDRGVLGEDGQVTGLALP